MRYRRIGVVGAGVMGVSLAQHLAQTGHDVVLVDLTEDILGRARREVSKVTRFAALFDPILRATDPAEIVTRIECTIDYDRLGDVDLVVENTTELLSVKTEVYPRLDRICHVECILAANTSAISITRLAALTGRADRVIGIHFMNPVPQKPVVEMIRGRHTSDATAQGARDFLGQLRMRAIAVRDVPGFVSNRVLMLTINEAISLVRDDVAPARDVDEIFVGCFGHKMGPLATADLIGLDTVLRSLEVLHKSYRDDKYQPCPLLVRMVDHGLFGRKSGRGFFSYDVRGEA